VLEAERVVNAPVEAEDVPIDTAFNPDTVDPRACVVAPNIILLFDKELFGILDNVLLAPEIVLFVSV
jgi:hypothetical protein